MKLKANFCCEQIKKKERMNMQKNCKYCILFICIVPVEWVIEGNECMHRFDWVLAAITVRMTAKNIPSPKLLKNSTNVCWDLILSNNNGPLLCQIWHILCLLQVRALESVYCILFACKYNSYFVKLIPYYCGLPSLAMHIYYFFYYYFAVYFFFINFT